MLLATFLTAPAHHPPKPCAGNEQKVRCKTSSAAHLFVHCFTCRNHYRSYLRILQTVVVTNRMKTCCIFYCFIFTRKEEQARLKRHLQNLLHGRGSVLAARDLPPYGQRGRCPSLILQVPLKITQKLRGGRRQPCDPCRVRSGYAPQSGTFWAANQDLTPIAHNPFTLYKQSLHPHLPNLSPIANTESVVLPTLFPSIAEWV